MPDGDVIIITAFILESKHGSKRLKVLDLQMYQAVRRRQQMEFVAGCCDIPMLVVLTGQVVLNVYFSVQWRVEHGGL